MSDTALSVPELDPRDAGTKIPVRFPEEPDRRIGVGTDWRLCFFCLEVGEHGECPCCGYAMCEDCMRAHTYEPCECPSCS